MSISLNHYRGSDQSLNYTFPMPYIYYKGKRIEADSSLINGKFYTSRFLTVKLTFSANPRVESETNVARQGMPELNWTFGVGPLLVFHIIKTPRFDFQLEHAIRREFETDFKYTKAIGISQASYITFRKNQIGPRDWSMEVAFGYLQGDKNLHNYFYTVDPAFANGGRPAYQAKGGFSGKTVIATYRNSWGNVLIFPFVRYDDLSGAVFEDSPLVKKKSYFMGGAGLFYLFD
ncbi:MAG: MipA/OmpV family protein [Bacteriovoracaceae bacterium]|nr:MipA/OmpV family protein [Bacteriovoracaceae bacterium]